MLLHPALSPLAHEHTHLGQTESIIFVYQRNWPVMVQKPFLPHTNFQCLPWILVIYPQVGNHLCQFSFFKKNYLFLAALGLCCCVLAFSSCSKRGLLFIVVCGLLIAVASLVAEHGLQAHGLQQLWHAGSVVVAHGLSCSAACGVFPDQGSNPCSLHWQADS